MPLFTIVVPAFDAEATLADAVASAQAQTFGDWEMIIADDGSRDGTRALARRLAAEDPRLRVLQLENGGPARARNHACLRARGDLIAFLDADDLWAPEKLATLAAAFGAAEAPDLVYARCAMFRGTPAEARALPAPTPGALSVEDLLPGNPTVTMSNVCVRAAVWRARGGFDERLAHNEDVEWLMRLVAGGARAEGVDATLTFYRTSPDGLSADLSGMRAGWKAAAETALRLGAAPPPRRLAAAEAEHCRYLARRALRLDDRAAALRFAAQALRASPSTVLDDPRRGLSVLAGALAAPFLPSVLRRALFSR